jgi:uncharacterized protein (DUF433 family)
MLSASQGTANQPAGYATPLTASLGRAYADVMESLDWWDYITFEPGKRSGQPCIRGMRITVYDVLEYLAGGMIVAEVLADFPELMPEDIRACFAFAADVGHRIRIVPA